MVTPHKGMSQPQDPQDLQINAIEKKIPRCAREM